MSAKGRLFSSLPNSLLVVGLVVFSAAVIDGRSKVLLVSFDAFRYDYFYKYSFPTLTKMAANGVHAKDGIIPTFATKTFPNHFTLVTGLYEEVHGIVDNDMYDPDFKEIFTLQTKDPKWWDGGEPVWNTAKKQGRKTAAAFWPGSDVEIRGQRPNFNLAYNRSITFAQRVDQAITWLVKDKVDFVALYFQEPDSIGHKFGIFTPQIQEAMIKVEATLERLFTRLTEANLLDQIDIIVLGDHGMVNTSNVPNDLSKVIFLDKIIDMNDVFIIPQTGTLAGIYPHPGKIEKVYNDLIKTNVKNMQVYKKEDIPDRWHYKNHKRIMPIVAFADEGYIIAKNKAEINIYTIGQHGYDNELPSMRPIFFAQGPSFKKSVTIKPFSNINVYSLLCHLMEITPETNNGTVQVFKDVLKIPPNSSPKQQPVQIPFLLAVSGILCFYLGRKAGHLS